MNQNNKAPEIEKVIAIIEEVEASFNFIAIGLKTMREQNSAISNNHVPLQLFASGFERIVKIILLLKVKHTTGKYPEHKKAKEKFKDYNNGHGILKMLDELIDYSKTVDSMTKIPIVKEDIEFIENNKYFREFLAIITEFSIQQRYYYIDTIVLENSNATFNPFEKFKRFIYSFGDNVDLSKLTYKEEDEVLLVGAISCIEKGVRAISRFFTHGLGDLGRQHYSDFSNFIFLDDKDLGTLKYTEKKKLPSDSYRPIRVYSMLFLKIILLSKAKRLLAKNYNDWTLMADYVDIYSLKNRYFFTKINKEVYALTGATSTQYKIPTYFASKALKPKAHALYLLEEAKKL